MSNSSETNNGINYSRRNLMMATGAAVATIGIASTVGTAQAVAQDAIWDKTFPKSDDVDHQKVSFKNRYGIALAGDLYLPKSRGDQALAALVISGPFGA